MKKKIFLLLSCLLLVGCGSIDYDKELEDVVYSTVTNNNKSENNEEFTKHIAYDLEQHLSKASTEYKLDHNVYSFQIKDCEDNEYTLYNADKSEWTMYQAQVYNNIGKIVGGVRYIIKKDNGKYVTRVCDKDESGNYYWPKDYKFFQEYQIFNKKYID